MRDTVLFLGGMSILLTLILSGRPDGVVMGSGFLMCVLYLALRVIDDITKESRR